MGLGRRDEKEARANSRLLAPLAEAVVEADMVGVRGVK